jgi:photosystem II stability/assembly factor-like uncharacterized protein
MSRMFSSIALLLCVVVFAGAGCSVGTSKKAATEGPAGIFVSTDKAENWQPLSTLPEPDGVKTLDQVSIFRLIDDPQDPSALYWASRSHGLYFSYDDGKFWQHAGGPLATGFVQAVAVSPIDKCTVYATNGTVVYKTTDCSRTYEEVYRDPTGTRITSLVFNPFGKHEIFLSKISGDILMSANGGESWSVKRRFGTAIQSLQFDRGIQNVMYAASQENGLFRTDDLGATWIQINKPLKDVPGGLKYRRLVVHPTRGGVIYWLSQYGILQSFDRGENFKPLDIDSQPGSVDIYTLAVNPKNDKEMYYTATASGRSALYKTTDGGASWSTQKLPTGQLPTILRVHPENDSVVYLGFTIPPGTK